VLASEQILDKRLGYEQRALADRIATVRLATMQYQAGRRDLLWVEQLQTEQLAVESNVIQLRNAQISNRIQLHLVLGGSIVAVRLTGDTGGRAWISALAALSTAVALIVLCVGVDENPATRNHLWILLGMILVSFGIEGAYRGITGRRIHLVRNTHKNDAATAD
jgi:hypothetical protein